MATDVNDPIAFALDANGDREILATTGCRFTTGLEAVKQNVESALKLVKGEWFLDLDRGVDLFDEDTGVLGSPFNEEKILTIYRDVIEQVPDVTEIITLTTTYEGATRAASVGFEVLTTFGTTSGTV